METQLTLTANRVGQPDKSVHFLVERWDNLRALAQVYLADLRTNALPDLPPLTVEQRRPINHRFFARSGDGGQRAGARLATGTPVRR